MDIRNSPVTAQQILIQSPLRADAASPAGPAAAAPVPPSLPPPLPSVVALSEGARSLGLRGREADPGAAASEEVDYAALQLELMLDLLKVYTPPPPPTPQELGEAVADALAAERADVAAQVEQTTDGGEAEPVRTDEQPIDTGREAAAAATDPLTRSDVDTTAVASGAARDRDDASADPASEREPAAAAERSGDARAAARYAAVEADRAPSPRVDLSA